MAKKMILINKNDLKDFSNEMLKELHEKYRLFCISKTPIENEYVKSTLKKLPVFATLRKNSILFTGNVEECKKAIELLNVNKIAFDFDGVINSYVSGWTGTDNIVDKPVEGIISFMKELQTKGKEIIIFSSRCKSVVGVVAMKKYLESYGLIIENFVDNIDDDYLLIDDRVVDYTTIDETNLVNFLETFDSWVNKSKIV